MGVFRAKEMGASKHWGTVMGSTNNGPRISVARPDGFVMFVCFLRGNAARYFIFLGSAT